MVRHMPVLQEVDRVLTLLRNMIRERGFTQLEVQEKLSWGRSYLSQLFTKQKALRVEQVLLVLDVIGVEPAEFYRELYRFPTPSGSYVEGQDGSAADAVEGTADVEEAEDELSQLRAVLQGVVQLLLDKEVFTLDELAAAASGMVEPDLDRIAADQAPEVEE